MLDGTINVLIKGFMSLIFLFFVIKLLGKKQVSQLNIFDYVIGISLGNLAAEMTINSDISIINGFLAMTIYGMCSLFVSYIKSKSIIARRIISGTPVMLMEKGKISKENLKKVKLDLNDLMQDAREDGIFDLSKVNYALMEASGKVTFLLKSAYEPLTSSDMKIKKKENSISAVLIMDGNIMENNLHNLGKDKNWLLKQIKDNEISNILLLLYNNGEITVYHKNYHVGGDLLE